MSGKAALYMSYIELEKYLSKPELYAPSTNSLWDDDHISGIMLDAHLNPDWDAASRKHEFVDKSVEWITRIAPSSQYTHLLDLGCGPGLYTERFNRAGYIVTGIDFSKRSIRYAQVQSALSNSNIEYLCKDYLTIDYEKQFDLITLIYCDYAVLPLHDRRALVSRVRRALKQNGKFIVDVFTPKMRSSEGWNWYYSENGGLYSNSPHLCLGSVYQYDDEDKTELRQSIIMTKDSIDCYNVWDHFFSKDDLIRELGDFGFDEYMIYGDIAGAEYTDESETVCGVFTLS